jgi:hypothetical protein
MVSSKDAATDQAWLGKLSQKWWFFVVIFFLFFIPPYSASPIDPTEISSLIIQVLSNSLIYSIPALFPIFKIIPLLLVVAILARGDRATRAFNIYAAVLSVLMAVFQTMAITERYGFAVMTGSLLVYLLVAVYWIWEAIVKRNDFSPRKVPIWRWWVAPLAFLAFWMPINDALQPDFSPLLILTSEAGVTYCMMTPVFLAVLTFFYPTVNLATLRVAAFVGLTTAVFNVIQEFFVFPEAIWMGVLHLPLLLISLYAAILAFRKQEDLPAQGK